MNSPIGLEELQKLGDVAAPREITDVELAGLDQILAIFFFGGDRLLLLGDGWSSEDGGSLGVEGEGEGEGEERG